MFRARYLLALLLLLFVTSTAFAAYPEVAYNKTATAISELGAGTSAGKAVDGNVLTTAWIAANATYPAWWKVDLGSSIAINTVKLAYLSGYNYSLNITVSNNDTTYTQVYSNASFYTGLDDAFSPDIKFSTVSARYIKIWLVSNPSNPSSFPTFQEVEVYAAPLLYTPSNSSVQSKTYPPLTTSINFTWSSLSNLNTHIIIAKDINFNLIVTDSVISNNYSVQSLEAGNYWWKARYYNSTSGTYGNYSSVFNFTLSNTQTISGTNIQGMVSELISGTATPISSATVYIYNTTRSSYQTTGSNGYYLFSGLAADTYTLYSTKADYETSPLSYVTTAANNTSTNNINMVRYVSPYITNFVYETILIQNIFGTPYVGSTVTLYEGDGAVPYKTATTDSTGQAVFYVIKDQKYRLTISGGGLSETLTYWIYGKEETYSITIISGFPIGGNRDTDISANLTVTDINATHKNLNLVYNDIIGSTSQIWFYATNLSTGVTCTQNSTSDSVTLSCAVLASGAYQFGFNATSTKYGYFKDNMVVNFDAGNPNTPIVDTNVDTTLLQWASIIILVILASLFSVTTIKFGAVILPLSAMVLWVFGWFEPAIGNPVLSFGLLSTAIVLGVLVYMRMSESKAVYQ